MPLYEDNTLEGAIKKAVWGKGPGSKSPKYSDKYPSKSPKSSWGKYSSGKTSGKYPTSNSKVTRAGRTRTENFSGRPFGSAMGGTGGSNFNSQMEAVRAAARAMSRQAQARYSDRVAAIRGGSRQSRHMIPELATLVEYYQPNSGDPNNIKWRFIDLHVGNRTISSNSQTNGRGDFRIDATPNMTDLVHAHWVGQSASAKDVSMKSRLLGWNRNREYPNGTDIEMGFYIFSFTHNITPY